MLKIQSLNQFCGICLAYVIFGQVYHVDIWNSCLVLLNSQNYLEADSAHRTTHETDLSETYGTTLTHTKQLSMTRVSLIGCTILRAVSGSLRTQRGRRGSGLGRQSAGATWIGPARRGWAGRYHLRPLRLLYLPPWLNSRPRGSTLAPVAQLSPPWLNTASSRPRGSALRPCGSTLSHLASVGG